MANELRNCTALFITPAAAGLGETYSNRLRGLIKDWIWIAGRLIPKGNRSWIWSTIVYTIYILDAYGGPIVTTKKQVYVYPMMRE